MIHVNLTGVGCFIGALNERAGLYYNRASARLAIWERGVLTTPLFAASIPHPDRAELLTSPETLRYKSYLRRGDTTAAIATLARDGLSIKQIVRAVSFFRQTLRGARTDLFHTR